MGEKEQAAELGEAISGRVCRKALRCLIAALLAEVEQVVGAAVVFLPPTVTQDYTLQNKMKLFPLFFNFMQLRGLDEGLQRAAARSCFYWENEKYGLPNQCC